jgi:hypothetical protein
MLADSSRCRIPSPSSTAFNRGSFHPLRTARHGDRLDGAYRRPPTSCAHRLRKPDRTSELLALSVARWARCCGLLTRAPSAPPCQARRCRRRFRTTATGRARTPSIGSTRALRPERARSRALFTCVASPRTLSPAASPSSPVKGRKGRLELSRAAPRGDPSTRARKMRLTDFCNRLPSRAPCGSFDSRVFLVALRCFASRRCGVSRPGTGSPWAFAPRRPGWGALPHAYRMSQPR